MQQSRSKPPILFVDIDGVISLFGFDRAAPPPGRFHTVDGIPHWIGERCGAHLASLAPRFELVWASGWEDRANEHLPFLLELPGELPTLRFDDNKVFGEAHWKIAAVDGYASGRPAAWIDDSLDERCRAWAASRSEPTLLIETDPAVGITEDHVKRLLDWADEVQRGEESAA
ncbi:MAG: HAD domain-containing protein [Thermoleophilaceae bacterium]